MTEKLEQIAELDLEAAQSVALARNWFETQAASFRGAQALIGEIGVDLDVIRTSEASQTTEVERAVHLKSIDAIKVSVRSSRLFKEGYETDISRQKLKNVTMNLLGQRATKSMAQADRREVAYVDSLSKTDN